MSRSKKAVDSKPNATEKLHQAARKTMMELTKDLRADILDRPEDQNDLLLVEFFFSKMPDEILMTHIVTKILPHAERIRKKDITFFQTERDNIFGGLPKDKVEYFSERVTKPENKGGISKTNLSCMFAYFEIFVEIGEAYKKKK